MVSRLTLVERGAQPPKPPRPPRLIRATTHYTNLADKLAKELGPNWTLKSTVDIPSSYQKKRFRCTNYHGRYCAIVAGLQRRSLWRVECS